MAPSSGIDSTTYLSRNCGFLHHSRSESLQTEWPAIKPKFLLATGLSEMCHEPLLMAVKRQYSQDRKASPFGKD